MAVDEGCSLKLHCQGAGNRVGGWGLLSVFHVMSGRQLQGVLKIIFLLSG